MQLDYLAVDSIYCGSLVQSCYKFVDVCLAMECRKETKCFDVCNDVRRVYPSSLASESPSIR